MVARRSDCQDPPQTAVERGQLGPLGAIFVFAFALIGAGLILVFVGGQLAESQANLNEQRAEKALTQFDSKAALVALGSADTQTAVLPTRGGGQYSVNGTTGRLRIDTTDATGNTTTILNVSLGVLTYTTDGSSVAYQGGGVWRASNAGGKMISPPEFHYRNRTLTFPVISVDNSTSISDEVTITRTGSKEAYPGDGNQTNPIANKRIEITVQSRFYRGWGEYFEQRTQSTVEYDDDQQLVNVTLVPPPEPIEIDAGVVSASNLDIESNAAGVTGGVSLGGTTDDEGRISGSVEENVGASRELTNASTEIARARQRLQNRSSPSDTQTVDNGSYYVGSDNMFSSQTTFNTSDGDIELFVDGNLSARNGSPALNVTGNGSVTIYVNGEFSMQAQSVWGNSEQVDSLVVYSEDVTRITARYGGVHTDAVSIKGQGGRRGLVGALISTAETVSLGGNAQVTHDSSLEDTTIQEVKTPFAGISYMYVTHKEIQIE